MVSQHAWPSRVTFALPFFLLFLISSSSCTDIRQTCKQVETLPQHIYNNTVSQNSAVIHVDPVNGSDTPACLNSSIPCATLQYALYRRTEQVGQSNITLLVAPGKYQLVDSFRILDSERVSIIGSGSDSTFFVCGAYGDDDSPCTYMNFQIRNSHYIYISGVTFTQCGPVTSNVYIADSGFVYFEDCVFR